MALPRHLTLEDPATDDRATYARIDADYTTEDTGRLKALAAALAGGDPDGGTDDWLGLLLTQAARQGLVIVREQP